MVRGSNHMMFRKQRNLRSGRAVDSHSTGTGKKSPAPKRNYVLTSTAYIEIDTVSKPSYNGENKWLISYLQSHLHTRQ